MHSVDAPLPTLAIVPTSSLHPHELHDSQRAQPLIERLRHEDVLVNPPIVAPLSTHSTQATPNVSVPNEYVILDGANRVYAFAALGYPHILVQIAPYESGSVTLSTWNHLVSDWTYAALVENISALSDIVLRSHQQNSETVVATFHSTSSDLLHVICLERTVAARNAAVCQVVQVYQQNATLQRTTLDDWNVIDHFYPQTVALVTFAPYQPGDIITAAIERAYLPPGVSRHIVQGRAVRVNYPMTRLIDPDTPLDVKNAELLNWTREKLAKRQVRYYAEATYPFDE